MFANTVLLSKSLGALTDGSVENLAMHPNPTVGRPPGQRGRKPGRRKTKVTAPWNQKSSLLGPQSIQPGKSIEPIKVPKKRGPKPGSKVGMMWFNCPQTSLKRYVAVQFFTTLSNIDRTTFTSIYVVVVEEIPGAHVKTEAQTKATTDYSLLGGLDCLSQKMYK